MPAYIAVRLINAGSATNAVAASGATLAEFLRSKGVTDFSNVDIFLDDNAIESGRLASTIITTPTEGGVVKVEVRARNLKSAHADALGLAA